MFEKYGITFMNGMNFRSIIMTLAAKSFVGWVTFSVLTYLGFPLWFVITMMVAGVKDAHITYGG